MDEEAWVLAARQDFPALRSRREGRPPVYLDNACTTLVPGPVIRAMDEYYTTYPGCGGARSRHWFAGEVTGRIEGDAERGVRGSRSLIQQFLNARSEKEIVFTQNASHAINIVALGFKFRPGDVVLTTDKEHNSNLLPWLRLRDSGSIQVEQIGTDKGGAAFLDALKKGWKGVASDCSAWPSPPT